MNKTTKAAEQYLSADFSVVPVGQNKRPICKWKHLQTQYLDDLSVFERADGLAIITGKISHSIEAIDVDTKYDLTGKLWTRLKAAIIKQLGKTFFSLLTISQTKSGGYHLIYRCETIAGNQKLASRPSTIQELDDHNATAKRPLGTVEQLPFVLIETRGEGGYIVAPPSAGYKFVQNKAGNIPEITPEQRERLLAVCMSFDEMPVQEPETQPEINPPTVQYPTIEEKPGEQFNSQTDLWQLLSGYGWTKTGKQGIYKGASYVEILRPGRTDSKSSGKIFDGQFCYIHSTSTPLPAQQKLTAFSVYAFYEHSGDFSAAAKALSEKGFGSSKKPKSQNYYLPPTQAPRQVTDSSEHNAPSVSSNNSFFTVLGFERTSDGGIRYVFFSKSAQSILSYSPQSITTKKLLTLCHSIAAWAKWFPPQSNRQVFDSDSAVAWMHEHATKSGYFDAQKIRGRGVWKDGESVLLHSGDFIFSENNKIKIRDFRSKEGFLYQSGLPLGVSPTSPMSDEKANELLSIFDNVATKTAFDSALLVGWCAVAPLCGVLEWRPHLWITGSAETGKSYTLNNIINPLLGSTVIKGSSDSTKAGIEQTLRHDARPITFDEAEGENQKAQQRMEQVLQLIRNSSSSSEARVLKGTVDGTPRTYGGKACFLLASVNHAIKLQADRTRITVIALDRNFGIPTHEMNNFSIKVARFFTERTSSEFLARCISKADEIMHNAGLLKTVIMRHTGNARTGDQLGTMLAGFVSLSDRGKLENERDAMSILQGLEYDFSRENEISETKDEERCLAKLMGTVVRLSMGSERTIAELLEIMRGEADVTEIGPTSAERKLKQCGIRPNEIMNGEEGICVANNAVFLEELFAGTAWAAGHQGTLLRVKGAEKYGKAMRFAGVTQRSVFIPYKELF